MSPQRARRDRQAAQVDQPGPHHDRHRSRHGCAVRAGRAHHRAAGRPRAGRRHAGRDQGQRARCRKPISAACTGCSNEPARGQGPEQLLRGFPHPVRRLAARRAQRGGGAARPQRRRQEHDPEKPDGRGDAARRLDRVRRRRDRRQEEPRHRAGRHAARPRGSPHLRQPQRRGEPRPRRTDGAEALAARPHLRDVPAAQGAARQPRHRPVRRRAADAGDRARAHPRSEDHPARRAVRGPGAGHRARSAEGLPRSRRRRPDHRAGRAEPRRDAWRWRSASTSSTTATSRTKARRSEIKAQPEILQRHLGV